MHSRITSLRAGAALAVAILLLAGWAPPPRAESSAFSFARDGILGTSLDLTFVAASQRDADAAEQAVLAEIERIRRIISTWDSTSEVSRLVRTARLDHPSPELREVLDLYGAWHDRSGAAYSARVGELIALWKDAERNGRIPDSSAIAAVTHTIGTPGWRTDSSGAITALTARPIDLNSLGKGYIIDHALAATRTAVPSLRGAMLNIGGDIRVWGEAPGGAHTAWRVGVADPRDHADNAVPLTQLALVDHAVSSSGDYERGFTINGRHYSHILDPRTGYPVDHVAGVTVIARDNATANALATTLSVLAPAEGLRLIATVPGAEALIVTAEGVQLRSPGFAAFEAPDAAARAIALATNRHAATISATMAIDVTPTVMNRHRPYVAAWITDSAGKHVRTLAFWGDKPKYQREMARWWNQYGDNMKLVDAVTRATRPSGKYTLEWDGLDQDGAAAPAGSYTFWLETAFEDGPHSAKSVTLKCGATRTTGTIDKAAAFTGAEVECGPAKP